MFKTNYTVLFQREALTAAAVAAGVSALSSAGQVYAQGKMNKKTREWNDKMYEKQRRDAIADRDFTNAYNSPTQQMQRFKEAGLNPNLIYGQQNEGAMARGANAPSWNPETPDYAGFGNAAQVGIQTYQDLTLQQETVKNMQQQRQNMALDAALKTLTADTKSIQNAQAIKLNPIAYDTAVQSLESMRQNAEIAGNQEERNQAMFGPNMEQALLKTIQMKYDNDGKKLDLQKTRQEIENLKKDGTLRELEVALKKQGMTWSDPLWLRRLAQEYPDKTLVQAVNQLIKDLMGDKIGSAVPEKAANYIKGFDKSKYFKR